MVAVFRTDICQMYDAEQVKEILLATYFDARISIDLSDCDKVLRIEGYGLKEHEIVSRVEALGFSCEELID